MTKKKSIDRIFQENFRDFEVYPSNKVWKGIEKELKKQPETKTVPLWQRLTGIAVALILFFSLGYTFFKPVKKARPAVSRVNVSGSKQILAEKPDQNILTPVYKKSQDDQVIASNEKKVPVKSDVIEKKNKDIVTPPSDMMLVKQDNDQTFVVINKNETVPDKKLDDTNLFEQKDIRDLQQEQNAVAQIDLKKEDNIKKWSVGANVSPVYMNSFTSGSAVSPELKDNKTVTNEALSYGVKLDYRLNNKVRIQSGVNKVGLSYNTKDVRAYATTAKKLNNNIVSEHYGIQVVPASGTRVLSENDDLRGKAYLDGDLNQSFDYLEIPFELKYNLYDSKVGFNLVGGFSTFILIDNQVSMISPYTNQSTFLGKANNLNSINFSGNIGFDIDYKISKDWFLNVSPMIKYQFNTFSTNPANFQPFYLGVYSGINYKF